MDQNNRQTAGSDRIFENIFENIRDGVCLVDIETKKFSLANTAMCRMLGYGKDEFSKLSIYDIHPAETIDETVKLFYKVLNNEVELAKDVPVITKKGIIFFADINASHIEFCGRPHLVSTFRNVTDRREAEIMKNAAMDELTRNEERMGAIIENSPFGAHSYELHQDGRLVLTGANRSADTILGINHAPLIGRKIEEAFPSLVRTDVPARYREVAASGRGFHDIQVEYSGGDIHGAFEIYAFQIGQNRMTVFFHDVTERKKAEKELQRKEEILRRTINTTADGILLVDTTGRISYINKRLMEMWNVPGDIIESGDDRPLLDFVTGLTTDPAGFTEKVRYLYSTDMESFDEVVFKDGRTFERYSSPLISEGVKFGRIWDFRDITARKNAEEALKKNEALLRSIFDASPAGISVHKMDRTIIKINESLCRITGYSENELLGRTTQHLYADEEGYNRIGEVYRKIQLDGMGMGEALLKKKDGSVINVLVCLSLVASDDFNKNVLATVLDITALKKAEAALKESEALFSSIFQASPAGILVIADRVPLKVNRSICRITGYSEEELLGHNTRRLYFDDEEFNRVGEAYKKLNAEGVSMIESRFRRKNGSELNVLICLSRIDPDDESAGDVAIILDITEQKKIEEERIRLEEMLLHSQKLESLGRLAGGIAHDFNNILTAIMGNTEMAMHQLDNSGKPYSRLKVVKTATEAAANLTKQLLAFSRKQVIEPKIINLNDLIDNVHKMITTLIGENIKLYIIPSGDLSVIKADSGQIEQVIINLAANARDAMPQGGSLTIETSDVFLDERYSHAHPGVHPGNYVMMAITDTGMGMSKETMDHIFEPFFTTKETGRGTGLGLATVYGIVSQNCGTIEVYTEKSQGTVFKVYFPASQPSSDDAPEQPETSVMPSGTETILITEDKEEVLEFCRDVLLQLGYNVLTAHSGEEAVAVSEGYKDVIHLFMTDVILPGMNGRTAAERILLLRPGIKVLYNSGYTAEVIDKQGILEKGINF